MCTPSMDIWASLIFGLKCLMCHPGIEDSISPNLYSNSKHLKQALSVENLPRHIFVTHHSVILHHQPVISRANY